MMKLRINQLTKRFGGIKALDGVSLRVENDELVGLIGPNGAGKTTFVNVTMGVFRPDEGSITLDGEHIDGLPPYEIAQKGMGRTFQITRGFRRLSVLENLFIPAFATSTENKTSVEKRAKEVLELLAIDRLKDELAENLSGGQQKLLELGRVLMLNPKIILLDEPFAGIHPELRKNIHNYIKEIHESGKGFIIISHDLKSIFALSKRLVVFNRGKKVADGLPDEVRNQEAVLKAYLGD